MANLGQEFRALAESFAHIIEGLAYIDEDEAGRLANKYSDELLVAVRGVYKDLADDMSAVLAKPPKKRRAKRKPSAESGTSGTTAVGEVVPSPAQPNVADIRAEANIGTEELPNQEQTIRSQQVDPEGMGQALEGLQQTLHSTEVTKRPSTGAYQESRTPPQKRID